MYNEDYIITKVKLAFKLREHSQIFCINERDVFFKNVSRCYVNEMTTLFQRFINSMINNISFTQNFSFFDIEKDNFMIKEEKNKNIKNVKCKNKNCGLM
ncbi:hypothetical protein C923_02005 [Plasmodium falciparum UGT5.1]|uniref:Uncharacterized protein n=2 Tax=Plasmodium falciparum TaxID=5833 RepID=W7JQM6_PLAFA|nr:hypothetical protein PFNF135_02033 [Plasmodium falciparum NF135/5.C10]EWC77328.1 hypothetical protein C923_02005 [Plasmodium falciparum UGT5.1]